MRQTCSLLASCLIAWATIGVHAESAPRAAAQDAVDSKAARRDGDGPAAGGNDDRGARPNIVFMLADDLGWADVGFHDGVAPTPNLDRLAGESLELTRHYVYPVCSPTRAAFLSGRYASRFGVANPQNQRAYPWETLTLARALKPAGYDTAICGKWHLGSKVEWGPRRFGFDHGYGSLAGGVGPWDHHYKKGEFTKTWHRDDGLVEEEGHVTDLIAAEAVKWIESRGDAPFFLYVPFTAVHIPIREPREFVDRVPDSITEPSRREYAACVIHLDDAVGRILAAIEKKGVAENTLVIFSSDNGGYPNARNDDPLYPADDYEPGPAGGDNRPFRGMKTQVYEGGVRVPTIARWPAKLKPGKFDAPLHITDWMPTFCSLAGVRPKVDPRWDGRDVSPWLLGESEPEPRMIYIVGPGFRSRALVDGDWKLVEQHGGKDQPDRFELFNLASDPSEKTDLSQSESQKTLELREKMHHVSQADRDSVAKD